MENKKINLLFISSLLIALIVDITLKGKVVFGLGLTLSIIIYLIIFSFTFKGKINKNLNISWFLTLIIILQALSFIFHSNKVILVIYFIFIPTLLIIQNLIFVGENKFKWSSFDFLIEIFYTFFIRIFSHFTDIFKFIMSIKLVKIKKSQQHILKIFVGLIISLPILIILVLLLSSADKIFSDILSDFYNNLSIDTDFIIVRIFIFIMLSILVFGFFKSLSSNDDKPKFNKTSINLKLDTIILSTVVILINLLYIVFLIVQFKYLFSGNEIPAEYNHANYARKGFFELVAVSSINLLILSLSYNTKKITNTKLNYIYKSIQSILIVNTFVILYSAFVRMNKYEVEYGYTILRIFTQIIMLLLLTLFLISLIKIFLPKLSLIKSYIITLLIFYTFISYFNIDKYIAKKILNYMKKLVLSI
jgi:hypothetical protein